MGEVLITVHRMEAAPPQGSLDLKEEDADILSGGQIPTPLVYVNRYQMIASKTSVVHPSPCRRALAIWVRCCPRKVKRRPEWRSPPDHTVLAGLDSAALGPSPTPLPSRLNETSADLPHPRSPGFSIAMWNRRPRSE